MKPYPERLIPKSNYIIIPQNELMAQTGLCLIRHVESKDAVFLPGTKTINPANIEIVSGHLSDLSTNLLGIFDKTDIQFVIDKETGKKLKYYELWNGTDNCELPLQEHYSIDDGRGCFYILVDKLKTSSIPSINLNDKTTENFHFLILHTPTNCNYWHISIKVYDSSECEVAKMDISDKKKRRIWKTVRDFLVSSIVVVEMPEYTTIDAKSYTKSDFSC